MFLRPIIDGQKLFIYKIATDKAKNLNGQFYTLSVFYVIRREMIVATTLRVLLLRRFNVLHVVSPDTTSSCDRACFREFFCNGFLRYILVKVVEPNPTGRFKRTFKLSKPDMDVVSHGVRGYSMKPHVWG